MSSPNSNAVGQAAGYIESVDLNNIHESGGFANIPFTLNSSGVSLSMTVCAHP